MRKLATNEIRLLALFSGAIFLALNLFAARAWMQARSNLVTNIGATRDAIAEGRSWIERAETIASARQWMAANPPPENTYEQASTSLLAAVAAAEQFGLKIIEQNILTTTNVTTGKAATLQIKVSGPFSGAAKFLFALQNPTAWRGIVKMMMRSEKEPPNVLVDIEIRQYYIPPADVNTTPGP